MKTLLILLLCFPLYLIANDFDNQKNLPEDSISIRLKIENGIELPINISTPIHGSFLIGKWVKSKTNDMGLLELQLPLDSLGFCQIWLNHLPWEGRSNCIQFFAKPGDKIEINFEKDNEFKTLLFNGDNAAENKLLNSFERYTVDYWGKSKYLKSLMLDKDAAAFSETLRQMEVEELKLIQAYAKNHRLNEQFTSILKEDVRYYYAQLFYIAFSVNAYLKSEEVDSADSNQWNAELEHIFDRTEIDNLMALGSYRYNNFKNATWPNYFDGAMLKIKACSKDQMDSLQYEFISKHFTGKVKEQHLAYLIKSNGIRNKYSPSIQNQYAKFRLDFPNSPYLPELEAEFDAIIKAQNKNLKPLIVFEKDDLIHLDELIKKYPNKLLYIDIWASWCGPCKMEFENHSIKLNQFFQDNEIQRIYLNTDKESKEEVCIKIINSYSLTGRHYLINKAFLKSIELAINKGESFPIPRYLIIDKSGNLVVKDAFRPSAEKMLIEQLKQFLE